MIIVVFFHLLVLQITSGLFQEKKNTKRHRMLMLLIRLYSASVAFRQIIVLLHSNETQHAVLDYFKEAKLLEN